MLQVRMAILDFTTLSPTEFENLSYDLLQLIGLNNILWRTPGADGGRDIEGEWTQADFSGGVHYQKWYVECKLYTNSIDWPTIWRKIAYAESRDADYLLLITNNNPSPNCENEIENWNKSRRRVAVRVWRGYELGEILRSFPSVAAKYGMLPFYSEVPKIVGSLVNVLMKNAQAASASYKFGCDITHVLDASSAISELISARSNEIGEYGKLVNSADDFVPSRYDWLDCTEFTSGWDSVGASAVLTFFRYVTLSSRVTIKATSDEIIIEAKDNRLKIGPTNAQTLKEISIWAKLEIIEIGEQSITASNWRAE